MIRVSACLLGENCKYNGGNNLSTAIVECLKSKEILPVCPEVLAGLGVPREPIELKCGVPYRIDGVCLEKELSEAISKIKKMIDGKDIEYAVLKSRSPTCGVKEIYDGSFTHTKIEGMGILARALSGMDIKVYDSEDFIAEISEK